MTLWTVTETAERLRIGKRTAERLIATGEIPSVKIGKRRLVSQDALDRYLRVAERRGRVA